jgi:hypothetical protein
VEAYDRPEDFAGIPTVKKSFPRNNYYLVLTASGDAAAAKMVASFKLVEEPVAVRLDNDKLLHKLFPSLTFSSGTASGKFGTDAGSLPFRVLLKNERVDYFTDKRIKTRLLVTELTGLPEEEGLYHGFLGLFDRKGTLLTPSVSISSNKFGWDQEKLNEGAQFGGAHDGEFAFYPCRGLTYILFVSGSCPKGSCCDQRAAVYTVSDAHFVTVQEIPGVGNLDKSNLGAGGFGWRMVPKEGKLLISKVPPKRLENVQTVCPVTPFRELKWNDQTCKFE